MKLNIHVDVPKSKLNPNLLLLDHLKALKRLCSYFHPAGQWNQTGWDGRVDLLTRTGTFPVGLTNKISHFLTSKGYEVTYTYGYDTPLILDTSNPFQLRPYQSEAVDAFLKQQPLFGIVHGRVRSGKTILAAHILDRLQTPSTFICERLDIAMQAVNTLKNTRWSVGLIGDGQYSNGEIVVSTIQSACQAFDFKPPFRDKQERILKDVAKIQARNRLLDTGFLVVDEAHHVAAASYGKILALMKNRYGTLGLSGTPWRDDGKGLLLEAYCGPVCYEVDYNSLIEGGWLCRPIIFFVYLPRCTYSSRWNYPEIYSDYITDNIKRNLIIADFCGRMVKRNKSTVVVVRYISHGHKLQSLIPDSVFVDESWNSSRRKEIWKQLNAKTIKVVITTLADEGLDIPRLDATVIAAGGKSSTKVYQRLRCLTGSEGKEKAYVLDFYDDARYLRDHSRERMNMYKKEPAFIVEEVRKYL